METKDFSSSLALNNKIHNARGIKTLSCWQGSSFKLCQRSRKILRTDKLCLSSNCKQFKRLNSIGQYHDVQEKWKLGFFNVTIKQHPPQHLTHIQYYYIDKSVLVENRPLVKFIRNYIRDSSGVFSISSLVRISKTSFLAFTLLFVQKHSCLYNKKKITQRL